MIASSIVLGCIWGLFAIGVVFALLALRGVRRERTLLEECKKNKLFPLGLVLFDERLQTLKKWLSEHRQAVHGAPGREACVGEGYLLQLRLETISDSVDKKASRKLPSLHDLHSLSLQDEMSRTSSVGLRTITSFLLILGILGTLVGVHQVVGSETGDSPDMPSLAIALEPSMWAVSCTILLMWLRGWYMARVDSYLEELDLYTMTEVIPMLQPVSDVNSQTTVLGNNMEGLEAKVAELRTLTQNMQKANAQIADSITNSAKLGDEIAALQGALEEQCGKLRELEKSSAEYKGALSDAVRESGDPKGCFYEEESKLEAYTQDVKNRSETVKAQYDAMLAKIDTSSRNLSDSSTVVNDILTRTRNLSKKALVVKKYDEDVARVASEMEHVKSVMEQVNQLRDSIEQSENLVYNSAVEAQKLLADSQSMMTAIKADNEGFGAKVQQDKENVEKAMRDLNDLLGNIQARAQVIDKLFNKRAKKINLN